MRVSVRVSSVAKAIDQCLLLYVNKNKFFDKKGNTDHIQAASFSKRFSIGSGLILVLFSEVDRVQSHLKPGLFDTVSWLLAGQLRRHPTRARVPHPAGPHRESDHVVPDERRERDGDLADGVVGHVAGRLRLRTLLCQPKIQLLLRGEDQSGPGKCITWGKLYPTNLVTI